jgi:hypothetical protein
MDIEKLTIVTGIQVREQNLEKAKKLMKKVKKEAKEGKYSVSRIEEIKKLLLGVEDGYKKIETTEEEIERILGEGYITETLYLNKKIKDKVFVHNFVAPLVAPLMSETRKEITEEIEKLLLEKFQIKEKEILKMTKQLGKDPKIDCVVAKRIKEGMLEVLEILSFL